MLIKRTFDVVLSAVALVLLAPVLLVISVLVKLDSRGPIFFRQSRVGCKDHVFRIYRFRTMTRDADGRKTELAHLNRHALRGGDSRMFKISNDPRVTRAGRFLRRFSLDEMPQVLNVLWGEMSLVGPRPLPIRDYDQLQPWHRKRYLVLPGMTGLWQVSGRIDLSFDDLVRLDFYYIENWSIWLDITILARTLPAVLARRGAY